MPSTTADCGCKDQGARERTCLCCDIPCSCRNNYYRGKLLTERDFLDEQRYLIDHRRLHSLRLHGWGVVCGLIARPHKHCPDKRMVVSDGFAIDSGGREIRVLADEEVLLPKPTVQPPQTLRERLAAVELHEPPGIATVPGLEVEEHEEEQGEPEGDDGCGGTPPPKDLYLCIRYTECETEFGPAPFDDCSCSTSSLKPNRVCESYKLELSEHKPEGWDESTEEECEAGDCRHYYREARECCTKIRCYPCLPLAVIHNFVPGQPVQEHDIDNWHPRRQLSSIETLDKVIRCILHKLPTAELTRIEDTNWEHNRRMTCHEFMTEFVSERGFRIEFSEPVHGYQVDSRSFQALVVFRTENMSEPKQMQIAPAHIEKHEPETKWCKLRIDNAYAKRHLENRSFDLFLTLRCDVITDLQGRAVDGNFIGHHLPTGDHIQGGTFESWIRVRHRR
jgi:hypothetical protein